MLREIAAFEWRYHTRQAAFGGAVLLFAFMGFMLAATGFGPSNVAVNSSWLLSEALAFLSLLSVFAAAIFCANAVLRDTDHRMAEIVHATPIGKLHYLGGRFFGAFLATLTATAFSIAGHLAGTYLANVDAERIAAFDPLAYLRAFAILSVPNVLFACAVLFAIAATTRSALASYAGAVLLYVLYFVASALTDSPLMAASSPGAGGRTGPALLDPFGLTPFFEMTRYWTVAEKNARAVSLSGILLVNRLVWVGGAAAIFAIVYRRFTFRLAKRLTRSLLPVAAQPASRATHAASPQRRDHRQQATGQQLSWLASYVSATSLELRALRTIPFLLLLLLWAALAGSELYSDIRQVEYGAAMYPATGLILATLRQPLALFGLILIIYYASEVFWREQRFRFAPIADTTPVPATAVLAAKWTALSAIVIAIIATAIAPGIALQIATGYTHFQPLAYLSLFWFAGLPLILFAGGALAINALVPNRYAGMIAVLLLGIVSQRGDLVGIEHPLFRFADAPLVRFSDMNGFGHDAAPFHRLMLHWAAVAALLFALTANLWRAIGRPVRERLRFARVPIALPLIVLGTGVWIFQTTDFTSRDERLDWEEALERKYARFASLPQPSPVVIDASVDLYPGERRVRIAGRDTLVNATLRAITTVLVSVPREAERYTISMPRARLASDDREFRVLRFELDRPLPPGARTELRYDVTLRDRDDSIVANGSYLLNTGIFPMTGYRRRFTIEDPRERRKRGLPEVAAGEIEQLGRIDLRLNVSTSADQIAVAPGRLVRSSTHGNRRTFRYESDTPILNGFAIASGRWEVVRRKHRGIDIELLHHPAHRVNNENILASAIAAFDYCSANFGPYPSKQLRLVELPSYWPFGGFALPDTIVLPEHRTFLFDERDPQRGGVIVRRIAHEVAHQWWGHRVTPKSAPGATTIVESLTKYAEMMVLERMRGPEQLGRLLAFEHDRYLAGRSSEQAAEVPLTRAEEQPYVYYAKGAIVFHAIRELISEERLNLALRNFFAEFSPHVNRATTRDLLAHLERVAPEEFPLIREWLDDITLYDFSIRSAEVRGRELLVRVHATKSAADGKGRETPRPMREEIEIRVDDRIAKHELREGENTIVIAVDAAPKSVEIDPRFLRIDRNRFDNVLGVR